MQKKLDRQAGQLSKSEQIARELQSRESDMQEALTVKDSQLSLLRQRLDEADQSLTALRKQIVELQLDHDRYEPLKTSAVKMWPCVISNVDPVIVLQWLWYAFLAFIPLFLASYTKTYTNICFDCLVTMFSPCILRQCNRFTCNLYVITCVFVSSEFLHLTIID